MPELYVYAILFLAVMVTIGFVLVMKDDKEVKQGTGRKAVSAAPPAAAPVASAPPVPAQVVRPDPVVEVSVERAASSAESLSPYQTGPEDAGPAAPGRRRRRPASGDDDPMRALVGHLSREVEELRAERDNLRTEARRLRDALADATVTIRSLEAQAASGEAAQGNVYSLPTKRAG